MSQLIADIMCDVFLVIAGWPKKAADKCIMQKRCQMRANEMFAQSLDLFIINSNSCNARQSDCGDHGHVDKGLRWFNKLSAPCVGLIKSVDSHLLEIAALSIATKNRNSAVIWFECDFKYQVMWLMAAVK